MMLSQCAEIQDISLNYTRLAYSIAVTQSATEEHFMKVKYGLVLALTFTMCF